MPDTGGTTAAFLGAMYTVSVIPVNRARQISQLQPTSRFTVFQRQKHVFQACVVKTSFNPITNQQLSQSFEVLVDTHTVQIILQNSHQL